MKTCANNHTILLFGMLRGCPFVVLNQLIPVRIFTPKVHAFFNQKTALKKMRVMLS
jgi:hypothetical protein